MASYSIVNPLGVDNLEDIFKLLSGRLLDVVIPIAVLLYVYAGFLLLTAAGDTTKVKTAKDTFQNTSLGLLVILIGAGFVDLIRSILNATT
ncbi:MAG: hypothetical protein KBC02_00925 [Candidatus Pacebacteria bacterium]|nr:hypothetical protein [Candidatus Paceibacterota bacterium]